MTIYEILYLLYRKNIDRIINLLNIKSITLTYNHR